MDDIVFFNLDRHRREYNDFMAQIGFKYLREERFIFNGEHWVKLIKTYITQPREQLTKQN